MITDVRDGIWEYQKAFRIARLCLLLALGARGLVVVVVPVVVPSHDLGDWGHQTVGRIVEVSTEIEGELRLVARFHHHGRVRRVAVVGLVLHREDGERKPFVLVSLGSSGEVGGVKGVVRGFQEVGASAAAAQEVT